MFNAIKKFLNRLLDEDVKLTHHDEFEDAWSIEKRLKYFEMHYKIFETKEDYINKQITQREDFIINEDINSNDLIRLGVLNGIRLEIAPAWHKLLKNFIIELDKHGWNRKVNCIKEKYATFCFYMPNDCVENSDGLKELFEKYSQASNITCESCGALGVKRTDGWEVVACREHYHLGASSIKSTESGFEFQDEHYVWNDITSIKIKTDYNDRVSGVVFKSDEKELCELNTSYYGFGKFIQSIPHRLVAENVLAPAIYGKGEYCLVCGLKSMFKDVCEACDYRTTAYYVNSGFLNDGIFSDEGELDIVKGYQMDWEMDGAALFYENNITYEMNPDFIKLFSAEELEENYIHEEWGVDVRELHKECNK